MKGVFIHEWQRLFGARSKWVHLLVHLSAAFGILVISGVFATEKARILEADVWAVTFVQGANDLLYILSMVYALWLAGRLFIRQPSDIVMVNRVGRLRMTGLKWMLGAVLLSHQVLCAGLFTLVLFNTAPYYVPGHLGTSLILWGILFSLQGFTVFSLVASSVKSSHTLGVVLGLFFLCDIVRSSANRPETLNHIQYLSFVILPSMRPSSDGSLLIMSSPWLAVFMHGLFIIILSISMVFSEY